MCVVVIEVGDGSRLLSLSRWGWTGRSRWCEGLPVPKIPRGPDATFVLAWVAVRRRRRYRRGTRSLWLETRCILSSVRPQVEVVVLKVRGKHVLIRCCAGDGSGRRRMMCPWL